MTHFRDLAASGVFEARQVSRRCDRPFGALGTQVFARIRATSSCMNADMIINLAT